uniref:RHS repeat domain-containing protein n=1 Tax=Alteromonas lipotrueiana TaxID=2803815 RepID=UPI001C46D57F
QATRKGFTDHEHLDEVELIHMNGRVYDYNLGRFLSVDPFIQGVGNSQGINPYSYVMNNPLGYTDPTGYTAEKEVEVKRAPKLGSRLGRSQTVTVTAKDGGLSISGGNGAARSAVRGALTNSLPSAEFNVSDIGSQTQIAKNDSSSGKQLTSVSRGKATSTTSGLKKSAHKSLEELRKKPEFAELEKKHGALTLTFDNKKKTELDGNTININKSIFSIEYEVDADASMDAYGGTLPDSMSDGAYYGAIERYQQSLPEYSAFSMNRVIVHEAFHLMQKHVSGFEYTINREHYEAKNIRRANQFMHKYFNEPFRDENHGKARSR